jgi:hypothetical protein
VQTNLKKTGFGVIISGAVKLRLHFGIDLFKIGMLFALKAPL